MIHPDRYAHSPDRVSVRSSNVDSLQYDAAKREMNVWFKSGAHYIYENVPQPASDALHSATSIGTHLAKNFNGRYSYREG